jgi:hypothetical protein
MIKNTLIYVVWCLLAGEAPVRSKSSFAQQALPLPANAIPIRQSARWKIRNLFGQIIE